MEDNGQHFSPELHDVPYGMSPSLLKNGGRHRSPQATRLEVARRFRCKAVLCGRQIFTERFPEGVLAPSARRTGRPTALSTTGLALGGRPAANFAKWLMLPVSNDTLVRVVRRRSRRPSDLLKVVGIDDWAWRRNHRYASIVCDLERRRIVTLLPDREPATAQAGFTAHLTVEIVARNRGGGYGEAAAKALPHAVQVAIAGI
jgi:transposase